MVVAVRALVVMTVGVLVVTAVSAVMVAIDAAAVFHSFCRIIALVVRVENAIYWCSDFT